MRYNRLRPCLTPWQVLAQRYIPAPHLIGGHKFGVRLWVVVASLAPMRVYLSARGLVLFSAETHVGDDDAAGGPADAGADADANGACSAPDAEGAEDDAACAAARRTGTSPPSPPAPSLPPSHRRPPPVGP